MSLSYSKIIRDLATKISIDPEGSGLKPFRSHNLRKMAQTVMEDAGVPLNWVDRILGHKPRGSQGATYSLPTKEKLSEKYSIAMESLQIYEIRSKSQLKIEELERRICQLHACNFGVCVGFGNFTNPLTSRRSECLTEL